MAKITIAAVGDILMKGSIIASAKRPGHGYSFGGIFRKVKSELIRHGLTIGNLETTFSGKPAGGRYERRSKATNYPLFNCPDALAGTLKEAGFNVLTTANNHCMDGGTSGLKRTLAVLDRNGLKHTGTARTYEESKRLLVVQAKGIKIGIAAYSLGTNRIYPKERWMVNRISEGRIKSDIGRLKRKADFVIVCLHFGEEYHLTPSQRQRQLVAVCFKHGANAVLGSHPHVVQPVEYKKKMKDKDGVVKNRVAAYSLGNFISSKLSRNPRSLKGMILRITVNKDSKGKTDITGIRRIKTVVRQKKSGGRNSFQVTVS